MVSCKIKTYDFLNVYSVYQSYPEHVFISSIAKGDLKYNMVLDGQNGLDPENIELSFPNDTYSKIYETVPVNDHGYRFAGWSPYLIEPSINVSQYDIFDVNDTVDPHVTTGYALWQMPCTVVFDASAGGGSMPEGWTSPYYYIGIPYGTLPLPTHPDKFFLRWQDQNGNTVNNRSLPGYATTNLTAVYGNAGYVVDLNDQWRTSQIENPDPNTYDGIYESFSNIEVDQSLSLMKITVFGLSSITLFIGCNGEGEGSEAYDYAVAFNVDFDPRDIPEGYYGYELKNQDYVKEFITGRMESVYDASQVTYDLDGGSHDIWIGYTKDSSYSEMPDRGYLAIVKQ